MKKPIIATLQYIIGWPLTIVAFFFIVKIITSNEALVLSSYRTINWLMVLFGIVLFHCYLVIRVLFWKRLLSEHGLSLTLKETSFEWASAEIKRYIPGNIWTLLSRTNNFSKKGLAKKDILSAFAVESEFIIAASMLISLFSVGFITYGIFHFLPIKRVIIFLIFTLTITILILFIFSPLIRGQKFKFLPHFPIKTSFSLLTLQVAAFMCFGLGTYFSISAITPLYLPDILTFVGFFVFSLLVGYLSFVTPMGLGIREGIITVGLSKFIPLPLAGLGAIFGRIVFIFSDILFYFLTMLWVRNEKKTEWLEKFFKKHWHAILLCVMFALYVAYFTTASFLRYTNFFTGRFDLGNMDQTVWNTLHGRIFQLTDPNGTNTISRFAFHADIILTLLAPFYLLWQNPKMLLLIQTFVLALGCFFIYLIATNVLRNKTIAVVLAFAYLIYPGLNNANLYDFHAVTLATTLLLAVFYFLMTQRLFLGSLSLFLAGLTKEEVWIVTAFIGLYLMFVRDKKSRIPKGIQKIYGISVFTISSFAFYFLVFRVIPHIRGSEHFALSYYSDFGTTPSKVIANIFLLPVKTIITILQPDRLVYYLKLFIPLGALSFFAPIYLFFALPDLAINSLSNNSQFQQIYFHYTSVIVPFIFISAIYGIKNILRRFPRINSNHIIYYILFSSIISQYLYGPLPGAMNANVNMFSSPQPNAKIITGFLRDIPKRFSVAATNNIGSHLSHRQNIFTIPVGIDKADIIVFLLNDIYAQPSLSAQKKLAETMKNDKNYIEVFKQGDFVVFEKRDLFLQTEPDMSHSRLFPLSIPALEHRDYTGGEITLEKKISENKASSEFRGHYLSDGITVNVLVAIPKRIQPMKGFPLVIINHGYVNPKQYNTENSYKNIVDFFVNRGFVVFKPDYRGNGKSETDNQTLEPLAYSIDVLNLISSVKSLQFINEKNIFLWGHALGGGVTLESLEVIGQNTQFDNMIRAASIWAPVTDPFTWYQQTRMLFPKGASPYEGVIKVLNTPERNPLLWKSISELLYVDDINTPLQISQGTADTVTPFTSSIELYNDLASTNKNARLLLYPNDNHFLSQNTINALRSDIRFFRKYMQ